ILETFGEANLGERASDERACRCQATLKHSAGTAGGCDIPGLENIVGRERCVYQVPHFMGEEPETLVPACGLSIDAGLISFAPVFGDSTGDGVVETSVQRAKVLRADRGVQFHCQFGDGLAHVTIVVDDLRDGEPLEKQVVAVVYRCSADVW